MEKTLQAAQLRDYQIRLYPWARAYDMALKEPNVLIFLIARTSAGKRSSMGGPNSLKIQYHLFRLKSRGCDGKANLTMPAPM